MSPQVVDMGDSCVTLVFDARVEPAINDVCLAVADLIERATLPGVRDVVPTYHTVSVHFDPLRGDRRRVIEELMRAVSHATTSDAAKGRAHDVPVCYGGEFGPDLEFVARFASCSEDEVITFHSRPTYRVYMMGFLPGFAYLGTVDSRIAVGRHDSPRMQVTAGSVGIAGFQTGIYPVTAPGGWRIIGRTWIRPFDLQRSNPWLFHARDAVRFVPVSRDAYLRGASETAADDGR